MDLPLVIWFFLLWTMVASDFKIWLRTVFASNFLEGWSVISILGSVSHTGKSHRVWIDTCQKVGIIQLDLTSKIYYLWEQFQISAYIGCIVQSLFSCSSHKGIPTSAFVWRATFHLEARRPFCMIKINPFFSCLVLFLFFLLCSSVVSWNLCVVVFVIC